MQHRHRQRPFPHPFVISRAGRVVCRFPLGVLGMLACCGALSSAYALDYELAAISARRAVHTDAQRELLDEWGQRGPSLGRDFLERAREHALADPRATEMVELYIQVAVAQADTARLRNDLTSWADQHPKEARFPYYLGLSRNQSEGASHFSRALELDAEFAPTLVALASLDLGRPEPDLEQARKRLLRAASLDPSNVRAFFTLSQLYRQQNDQESRLLALRRWIEIDPEGGQPRQALFQALQEGANEAQKNGTFPTWVEQTNGLLEELAGALPGQSALLYTAARIWMSVNQPERALADLEAAVAAGFDDPHSLEADGAFASLDQSGRLEPLVAQAVVNRGKNEPQLRRELRSERVDLAAPDFELTRQGGGSVRLSELRGKVVILDFWATWCGPCRKSFPVLQSYFEKKPQNVEVFCVNIFERDGGKSVGPFWKQNAFPMPVLLGTAEVAEQYAVSSIPTLVVIGPDGRIGYRHQGFNPYMDEQIRWMAEDLLGL